MSAYNGNGFIITGPKHGVIIFGTDRNVIFPNPTIHEVNCERVNSLIADAIDAIFVMLWRLGNWMIERGDGASRLADEIRYGDDFWL